MTSASSIEVGLISPLPPQLGGVATVARWLLDNQDNIGCRYVTFDLERPINEAGGRLRLETVRNQAQLMARFLAWARKAPSVVHCMVSPTRTGLSRDLAYLAALRTLRRRTVAHVHIVQPELGWWRYAMRAVGRLSDEVVVLGTPARQALAELGVPSRAIPNAIPFVPPADAARQARESNGLRLLFVGTFGERKGCHELLQAMALLRDRGVDCSLKVVGREEYVGEEERLRGDVRAHGLDGVVDFLGQRAPDELPPLYSESDVFCLPSRLEGLPLALIEAMAHGMPAVATPVGCVEDLVIHEETGLLARVADPASLADEIEHLATDPTLRSALAEHGSRHVVEHMGPGVIADAWRSVYLGLV
jgi:glycosyltransferase involved in cell wall biosynthesis